MAVNHLSLTGGVQFPDGPLLYAGRNSDEGVIVGTVAVPIRKICERLSSLAGNEVWEKSLAGSNPVSSAGMLGDSLLDCPCGRRAQVALQGAMGEWLASRLQNELRGFESRLRL